MKVLWLLRGLISFVAPDSYSSPLCALAMMKLGEACALSELSQPRSSKRKIPAVLACRRVPSQLLLAIQKIVLKSSKVCISFTWKKGGKGF